MKPSPHLGETMADLNAKPISDLLLSAPKLGAGGFIAGNVKFKGTNFNLDRDNAGVAEADNDVFRFFRINSGDIPLLLWFYGDDRGGTAAGDCGLHTIKGGAVVDADVFSTGIDFSPIANTGGPRFLNFQNTENLATDAENSGYLARVWQHLGLTSDPHIDYDLTVTMTNNGANATVWLSCGLLYANEG